MEIKTNEELIQAVNDTLEELHRRGVYLDVDASRQISHPFPKYNPCSPESTLPSWVTTFFYTIASPCRCCSGVRIFVFFLTTFLFAVS